jgi:hypothetical protein
MFSPLMKGVMRFSSNDPELGIEIHGHVILDGSSLAVIDPPMLPGLDSYLKVLGKPEGVILTNYHHARGSLVLAGRLGTQLYVPKLQAANEASNREKFMGCTEYGESTKLPLGILAHHLRAGIEGNPLIYEEMILQHGTLLAAGDSAWGKDGGIEFFPAGIFPDPENRMSGSIRKSFGAFVRETGADSLISGHREFIRNGLSKLF